MIQITNVNKIYKGAAYETHALKNISMQIQEGDYISLMGRSGSGKSTLLNILGFLDQVTDGTVTFMNEDVSKIPVNQMWKYRKKYIGFVFQHFALMNDYSVYENVALPLQADHMAGSQVKRKVLEQLDKLEIGDLRNQYPDQISGGQKQRVAIARALVRDPALILADEPTGALDYETGQSIMALLDQVHKQGKTILVVTHDENIAKHTDQKIIIQDGSIMDCTS